MQKIFKNMVLLNSIPLYKWFINGQLIEQVKQFRYMGVIFQSNLSWTSDMEKASYTHKAIT